MRILFLNPQGNFDPQDKYWTEHPDFGGQLVYVKEIALAMSELGHLVDIVTRQFTDDTYAGFESPVDHYPGYENCRIVRIPAGPNAFLPKESLWEVLHEWVEGIINFYYQEDVAVDFITTHYGDGGVAGAMLSEKWGVPFSFTGHSLGAQKMDKLGVNLTTMEPLNQRYQFAKRLMAERTAIEGASVIFTSTPQERDEQYFHPAYRAISETKPDAFVVAPPGVNEKVFGADVRNAVEKATHQSLDQAIVRDIDSDRLDLPYIVLASRLDQKKNHIGVLEAYANSVALQGMANIAISIRGIEDVFTSYESLKPDEKVLMDAMMALIDAHNLRGKITFVNITSQLGLAAAYRYFTAMKSIFALTSTYEPFGLAPIEAMCAGLPAAVTQYGGPADVLKDEDGTYGVLLDVMDTENVIKGLMQIFKHYTYYYTQGMQRVKDAYTWKATAKKYVEAMEKTLQEGIYPTFIVPDYFKSPSEFLDFHTQPITDFYLNE